MNHTNDPWTLDFDGWDPADEGRREALCTLGNGRFATRGAAPESAADGVHYPGTYAAGCYDRLRDEVAGRAVENESLVNLPNWLHLRFAVDYGEWVDLSTTRVLEHRLSLDLRRGLLHRRLRFVDAEGRTTSVRQRRFVHMGQPHLAGLHTVLTAEDWTGTMRVVSGVDGSVTNAGVRRYDGLAGRHLAVVATGEPEPWTVLLVAHTVQYRGRPLTVQATGREVRVAAGSGPGAAVRVGCGEQVRELHPGETAAFLAGGAVGTGPIGDFRPAGGGPAPLPRSRGAEQRGPRR